MSLQEILQVGEWDFGDGAKSNMQNPDHEYITLLIRSDFFNVTLIACNSNGCDTEEKIDLITCN